MTRNIRYIHIGRRLNTLMIYVLHFKRNQGSCFAFIMSFHVKRKNLLNYNFSCKLNNVPYNFFLDNMPSDIKKQ